MLPVAGVLAAGAASSLIGGGMSLFGGRRQQSAANAQAAAQMQFERENMFHQNQVGIDMMHAEQAFNSSEAAASRDWNAGQAQEARDWNAAQFGIERTFNAEEAAKNRAFQADMSNTQYQRAVKDMQAAGLNPMLGYSQGGAGNVSGASASAGSPSTSAAQGAQASASAGGPGGATARGGQAQQFNYLASAIATAAQVGQLVAGVRQMDAQTEKTKAETEAVLFDAEIVRHLREDGFSAAKFARAREKSALSKADQDYWGAWSSEERFKQDKVDTERKGLELPKARADAEYQQLMLELLKGGSSSAAGMGGMFKMILPIILKSMEGK